MSEHRVVLGWDGVVQDEQVERPVFTGNYARCVRFIKRRIEDGTYGKVFKDMEVEIVNMETGRLCSYVIN